MPEYFIYSHSFAAPFFSDEGAHYIQGETPEEALTKFAAEYKHPCGLYAANCYESADAYHKGEGKLAQWLCNHEIHKQAVTAGLGSYSYLGDGPGRFRVNDTWHNVKDPENGKVVDAA